MTENELVEIDRIFRSFPIELAECRASAKQLKFQNAFFERRDHETGRPLDIFVALGGNRSGKTFVCGWMCFAKFLRDCARAGDSFWCIAPNEEKSIGAAGGQQSELWKALPRWMFGEQTWKPETGFKNGILTLPTVDGGRCVVEFKYTTQAPTTFESGKLTGVWVDERLPEEIYNRLLARVIDRNGFFLYSDIPEQFWQYERLQEADPAAGIHFQHFEMADNEHNLPAGTIAKKRAQMTTEEQKLRIAGLFVNMVGLVFAQEYKDALRQFGGHLIKPFKIPPEWPRWRAIDYGGSAPTACSWWVMNPSEQAICYREYYERGLSIARNAKMIITLSGPERYVETLIDPHAFDSPPAYYGLSPKISDQYKQAGIVAKGWPFIQTIGEHAAVQKYKFRMENRTIFWFDTLTNYRRELKTWKYKTDEEGRPLAADAFENDNNHLIDTGKGWLCTNPCFSDRKIRAHNC